MTRIEIIFKYSFALLGLILIALKGYFMFSSPFSRQDSRTFRNEYLEIFEYSLSEKDKAYWHQVIRNYENLNDTRQSILKTKLSKDEVIILEESIYYLKKIVNNNKVWIPQKNKDYLIYFKNKRVFDYLYNLQASVLEN